MTRHMMAAVQHGVLVQSGENWQVIDGGEVVEAGTGLAVSTVGGDLVVLGDGRIPGCDDHVRADVACGWRDGVVVAGERGLWHLTGDTAHLLVDLHRGDQITDLYAHDDRLFFGLQPASGGESMWRTMVLDGGQPVDATPDLDGIVSAVLYANDGVRIARRSAGMSPVLSHWAWWRIMIDRGSGWQPLTNTDLHLAPGTCQLVDDEVIFPAYDGIRVGAVAAHLDSGTCRWITPTDESSYFPVVAEGTAMLALQRRADGSTSLVRLQDRQVEQLAVLELGRSAASLFRWSGPACTLEGLQVTADADDAPQVIDLHNGPEHVLYVGCEHDLDRWATHGVSALAPEYSDAGIAGPERYIGAWAMPSDPNAQDVLSAAHALGMATTDIHLFGHSWGASLLARMLASGHRFTSAVCWEGWETCSLPGPSRWLPDLSHNQTPLLLAYGSRSPILDRGRTFHEAARQSPAPVELWIYDGDHFAEGPILDELYTRAANWYRQWH